jgi:hypothetical protein
MDADKLAQAEIWHGAIKILDESELTIRDTIERGLSAVSRAKVMPLQDALAAATNVLVEVNAIRVNAIKSAFRRVRGAYDGSTIGERTLAEHAAIIARADVNRIDTAIRSGLSAGFSSTDIARRVVGSASLNGTDGSTEMTRQHIARLGLAVISTPNLRTGE